MSQNYFYLRSKLTSSIVILVTEKDTVCTACTPLRMWVFRSFSDHFTWFQDIMLLLWTYFVWKDLKKVITWFQSLNCCVCSALCLLPSLAESQCRWAGGDWTCPRQVFGHHQMEGGAGDVLEGSAALQRDPASLEEQADRNLIKFAQDKGKSCAWEGLATLHQDRLGTADWQGSSSAKTIWGSWWAADIHEQQWSQQDTGLYQEGHSQ